MTSKLKVQFKKITSYKTANDCDYFVLTKGRKVIESGTINYFLDLLYGESTTVGISFRYLKKLEKKGLLLYSFRAFVDNMIFDIPSKTFCLGKYRLSFYNAESAKMI